MNLNLSKIPGESANMRLISQGPGLVLTSQGAHAEQEEMHQQAGTSTETLWGGGSDEDLHGN